MTRIALSLVLGLLWLPMHVRAQAAGLGDPVSSDTPVPAPPSTSVTPPTLDPNLETTLDAWLVAHADRARGPRIAGGVMGIVLGAAVIGLSGVGMGIWSPRSSTGSILVVEEGLLMGLGAIDVALGIYQLVMVSLREDRLARWRAIRERGPVSARDIGRFEGEIHGEVMQVEQARWASLALGIGAACGGLVGLGLTAGYADSTTTQWLGYGASGLMIFLGALLAVLPWLDTSPEDEWRQIDQGVGPRLTSVAPWGNANGGGLVFDGTF